LKGFETFGQLEKLSKSISETNSKSDAYKVGWQFTAQLTEAIELDMLSLFEFSCYVSNTRFIIEDPSYRQSASIVKFEIRFEQDEQFMLIAECLIDFGRIWLSVKNRPASKKFDHIADKIENKYDSEFLTDIEQLDR
jgi:hypothetical protein